MNNTEIMPTINKKQMVQAIKLAIATHENIMIVGSPGSGKTQITELVAKSISDYVYVATPAVEDPTTPLGMPVKVESEGETSVQFLPFKLMKKLVEHDPDGDPAIVILDDFGQSPPSVQAGYMQVIQDHRVGEHSFPDNVSFILLTNDRTDKSGVKPIFEAIKQRMAAIYKYSLTLEEWIEWAYKSNIYPSIPAYLRFKPEAFNSFEPTTELVNQPCARTWHKLSKQLHAMDEMGLQEIRYAACIGAVAQYGAEFAEFEKFYTKLPDIPALIAGKETFTHDTADPALTYALCGALVHNADKKNIKNIIKVVQGLPKSFQIAMSKDLRNKEPELIELDVFTDWCVDLMDIFDL